MTSLRSDTAGYRVDSIYKHLRPVKRAQRAVLRAKCSKHVHVLSRDPQLYVTWTIGPYWTRISTAHRIYAYIRPIQAPNDRIVLLCISWYNHFADHDHNRQTVLASDVGVFWCALTFEPIFASLELLAQNQFNLRWFCHIYTHRCLVGAVPDWLSSAEN